MPAKGASLERRLTAKVGPLPVWAWAAVILGGALLYLKLNPGATQAQAEGTTVANGDSSGAQQPNGGGAAGGGLPSSMGDQPVDFLTGGVQSTDAGSDGTAASMAATGAPFSRNFAAPTSGPGSASYANQVADYARSGYATPTSGPGSVAYVNAVTSYVGSAFSQQAASATPSPTPADTLPRHYADYG